MFPQKKLLRCVIVKLIMGAPATPVDPKSSSEHVAAAAASAHAAVKAAPKSSIVWMTIWPIMMIVSIVLIVLFGYRLIQFTDKTGLPSRSMDVKRTLGLLIAAPLFCTVPVLNVTLAGLLAHFVTAIGAR